MKKRKKKKGKNKSWAQKKEYDGIQFQSLLEVYCYQQLKKAGLQFSYEKIIYTLLDGFNVHSPVWTTFRKIFKARMSAVRPVTYTPDFVCRDGKWVIETKGWKSEGFKFRWKLFLRYIKINKLDIELFMPTSKKEVDMVVKYLKEKANEYKTN